MQHQCSINADHNLFVEVIGRDQRQLTNANICRSRHHGKAGINRLLREILEEMIISRRSTLWTNSRCLALRPRLLSYSSLQPSRSSLCTLIGDEAFRRSNARPYQPGRKELLLAGLHDFLNDRVCPLAATRGRLLSAKNCLLVRKYWSRLAQCRPI